MVVLNHLMVCENTARQTLAGALNKYIQGLQILLTYFFVGPNMHFCRGRIKHFSRTEMGRVTYIHWTEAYTGVAAPQGRAE